MARTQVSKKNNQESQIVENNGQTNSAIPLQVELESIAKSLQSIVSNLEYMKIVTACEHAKQIRNGIKNCPFCEITLENSKFNKDNK